MQGLAFVLSWLKGSSENRFETAVLQEIAFSLPKVLAQVRIFVTYPTLMIRNLLRIELERPIE